MQDLWVKEIKNISEHGEWWKHPMWDENRLSAEENSDLFELKKLFPKEIFLKMSREGHPLSNIFRMGGSYPFNYLCNLGMNLYVVEQASKLKNKNLFGDIKKGLINIGNYNGAEFELRFLANFIREGFEIEKDPFSGKGNNRCDFKVYKGENIVFFECKWLDMSKHNQEITDKNYKDLINYLLNDDADTSPPQPEVYSQEKEVERVFTRIEEAVLKQLPKNKPGVIIIQRPLVFNIDKFKEILAKKILEDSITFSNLLLIIFVRFLFTDQFIIEMEKIIPAKQTVPSFLSDCFDKLSTGQ